MPLISGEGFGVSAFGFKMKAFRVEGLYGLWIRVKGLWVYGVQDLGIRVEGRGCRDYFERLPCVSGGFREHPLLIPKNLGLLCGYNALSSAYVDSTSH